MSPQYHLLCQGLVDKPVGGWFCNNECKKNAGYRVEGGDPELPNLAGEGGSSRSYP